MRAVFKKYTILETPWLIFAGIANDVSSGSLGLSRNGPLAAYGKSRAATAAQTGSGDFVQDVFRYWLVPSCRAVFIEGFVVGRFAFGKEDHDSSRPKSNSRCCVSDPLPPSAALPLK